MNLDDFRRILISFSDNASDIEITKGGKLTAFIRGEALEAEIILKDDEIYVKEDNNEIKAIKWVSVRLAQLEQLAVRILDFVKPIPGFINPKGMLLDDIEYDPSELEKPTENVTECLQTKLGRRMVGATDVVYLTSDAGEGKTTVINHLARLQADLFKKKQTSWLLVPIPLGGRPFLRFDDIVIASLVNRLRFRLFYYESFIELVKLGLIIPAFDGFEEMFMENSSGEALSATGHLMAKLESKGNALIAARKAYFDYKSFSTQAKLFDTIGSNAVSFSKISIERWDKNQFIEYSKFRRIADAEKIYDVVSQRLGAEHPLLTRPVLVNRLLSVVPSAEELGNIESALESSSEYFPGFIDAIITREAEAKWIDTSGEPLRPLITFKEHYEILSMIAEEMWLTSTDSLDLSVIDLLAELYCESKSFPVRINRQIKERLKQHALLVKSDQNAGHLKFDHEAFQDYFLGCSFFEKLKVAKVVDLKNLLRKGPISDQTVDTVAANFKRERLAFGDIIKTINLSKLNEGSTSFVKENCGKMALKILSSGSFDTMSLENYDFPINCLNTLSLSNLVFSNCHFQTTVIANQLRNCRFDACTFDSIEIDTEFAKIENVVFRDTEVLSVQVRNKDTSYYDPFHIKGELIKIGVTVEELDLVDDGPAEMDETEIDENLELTQKVLRRFIRGSFVNDSVFRLKLGANKAPMFIDEILPVLLDVGILSEVDYSGQGQKRRFKLTTPFEKINRALEESRGSFEFFISKIKALNNRQ